MPNLTISRKNTQEKVAKFFDEYYSAPLEFPSNEVDAVIGFFENRGFEKISAQTVGSVLMRQAKIDNIKPQQILDQLTYATPALLSELITIILNANRYKSSRLGVRKTLATKDTVSRNIID